MSYELAKFTACVGTAAALSYGATSFFSTKYDQSKTAQADRIQSCVGEYSPEDLVSEANVQCLKTDFYLEEEIKGEPLQEEFIFGTTVGSLQSKEISLRNNIVHEHPEMVKIAGTLGGIVLIGVVSLTSRVFPDPIY